MRLPPILLALFLTTPSLTHPTEPRSFQTVHLTFHGGPASYDLTIPADGTQYPTNNDIAVSIIDAPDFNADNQCTFYSAGEKAIALSVNAQGVQQLLIGPPQPITAVSCTGTCVATYGMCYGTDGQYVGPCCTGFCAASRCRPWVQPL